MKKFTISISEPNDIEVGIVVALILQAQYSANIATVDNLILLQLDACSTVRY